MAKYCITLLVLTVFPAPDSPLKGWCKNKVNFQLNNLKYAFISE